MRYYRGGRRRHMNHMMCTESFFPANKGASHHHAARWPTNTVLRRRANEQLPSVNPRPSAHHRRPPLTLPTTPGQRADGSTCGQRGSGRAVRGGEVHKMCTQKSQRYILLTLLIPPLPDGLPRRSAAAGGTSSVSRDRTPAEGVLSGGGHHHPALQRRLQH